MRLGPGPLGEGREAQRTRKLGLKLRAIPCPNSIMRIQNLLILKAGCLFWQKKKKKNGSQSTLDTPWAICLKNITNSLTVTTSLVGMICSSLMFSEEVQGHRSDGEES